MKQKQCENLPFLFFCVIEKPGTGSSFAKMPGIWILTQQLHGSTTLQETHHNHEVIGELLECNEELLVVLPIDGVEPGLA